jgi:hypothetical protein
MRRGTGLLRNSGFALAPGSNELLGFTAQDPGQNCPQHCPQALQSENGTAFDPLGTPLSIQEVARLIGCSSWTVRHKYVRAGLPHLRMGSNGKLIFYRNQVINWLLSKQQKGGTIR